jgi:hypothetical protein
MHETTPALGQHSRRRPIHLAVSLLGVVSLWMGLGITVIASGPAGAAGTTFYVAQGATGTTCSSTAPTSACPTVSAALGVIGGATGDVIDVAGTIADNVTVSTTVTIQQWPGQAAAILDGGGNGSVITIASNGDLTLDQVTVTGGDASNEGGGIDNANEGGLEVEDSTIDGNTAAIGGGIASQTFSTVTIDDSNISGNSSSTAGGGIFSADENLVMDNSTVSGNSSTRGGGIYTSGAPGGLTADNSTIVGNIATSSTPGDDASAIESAFTATDLAGDIVVTPNGSSQPACVSAGSTETDEGYNIDSDGSCQFSAANNSVSDSSTILNYLGPLQDNGGPTETIALAPGAGNLAQAAIPASFMPPGESSPSCQQPDQRGIARATPCDMGAYALSVPISSASATTFTTGTPGSFAVSVSGTPSATFTEIGTLPVGVSLSPSGLLSGTPSPGTAGVYPITIIGSLGGNAFTTQPFTLTVQSLAVRSGGSAMAATHDGTGYWVVGASGAVTAYGTAANFGSVASLRLNAPVVGMASTPDGRGYWLVGADGGVFTFGDAPFLGSMGGRHLNQPVVGMASAPDGGGYWLVAADGGVFSFGGARFYGSAGSTHLNRPVVGIAASFDGRGYWLVASDGGVFTYGDAAFYGSTGSIPLHEPMIGLAPVPDGLGYWLVASDGGVFAFGDAGFFGSAVAPASSALGLVTDPDGLGYSIVHPDGSRAMFGV